VFIDEEQVASLEKKMNQRGYLEGSEMAGTFNLLRANDLVWSFVVNNYLLGKDPFPFDLLYWNADSTRMPARMHSFYLRNMYIKNLLAEPGGIELDGCADRSRRGAHARYFISTVEDHIAPWKTTYKGAKYLGGPVRFVLGGSGHIAGIVNPPRRRSITTGANEELPATPDAWFAGASQIPGSWWEDWQAWIERLNGRRQGAGARAAERPGGRARQLRHAAHR
jgi:polyhydroxyalkanoate synthase